MPVTTFPNISNGGRSRALLGGLDSLTDPVVFAVNAGEGNRFPAAPFVMTVWDDQAQAYAPFAADMEMLYVTNKTGDIMAATRGYGGTTIQVHPGTPAVRNHVLGEHFAAIFGAINTLEGLPGFTIPLLPAQGGTGTVEVFTSGRVVFAGASGAYQQDDALFWDDTNKRLGLGLVTPAERLHLQVDTSVAVRAVLLDGYGANRVGYRTRYARGTAGTPTAAQSGDVLGFYGAQGRGATGFVANDTGAMRAVAAENFSDTANGTDLVWLTTPSGSLVPGEQMRLGQDGTLTLQQGYFLPMGGFVQLREDWIGVDTASTNTIGELGWTQDITGPGALISITAGLGVDQSHPGVATLTTGTNNSGRAGVVVGGGSIQLGGGAFTWVGIVRLSALSTAGVNVGVARAGLGDTSGADHVDGVYFEYNATTGPNWQCKTANNSSRTPADSGVPVVAATYVVLQIDGNAAGTSMVFRINGVVVATIVSNIPTAAGRTVGMAVTHIKTVGTTSLDFQNDLSWFRQKLTTPRA